MDNETLRKLQKTELKILIVLDTFCKQYNIKYSLSSGTALGAIRHGGFIPWDDDIDVTMTREEYIKFCRTWEKHPIEGYYLDSLMLDGHCNITHSKLRMDGTEFLSGTDEDYSNRHNGIWVDIFPLDKFTPENEKTVKSIGRRLIILSRANDKIANGGIKKAIIRGLLRLIPYRIRLIIIQKDLDRLEKNANNILTRFKYIYLVALYTFKYVFPSDLTNEMTTILFEGIEFPIYADYDTMLKINFGDYMKLPPEEDRICKHNPQKIVFPEWIE